GLDADTLGQNAHVLGSTIGPYKLLEQIGEGGMGIVYMAEQERPVRRKVAVKIIKPGMDSRQVIARFEAERQALALMDHPNIARIFDAGTTPSGRPYFIMELVHGVPITRYCAENPGAPGFRARLELFVCVCQAVQRYELLTGATPVDKQRLETVSYEEVCRIIREEEPPRIPNVRELDWIVRKALEKDRSRRYETASAFAEDVQRYLRDEPVQA